jgi:hypothetical protein
VEKAVELFVYAPVGMACYFRDMLPSMMGIFVARGKREVDSHRTPPTPPAPSVPPVPPDVKRRIDESVGAARYVAEGGFGVARDVAGSGFEVAREVAGNALSQFLAMRAASAPASSPAPGPVSGTATDAAPRSSASDTSTTSRSSPGSPGDAGVPPDASWHTDVPAAESLPIPGYDELSASQVVERLEGLDRDSLETIRRYETAHRGRNTILGKIAQLG